MALNFMTAEEAAELINHGDNIGLSGFTPAGTAKAVTFALAKRAEAEHAKGHPFQVGIFTGASTGNSCDGVLSVAKAIRYRAPYTTNKDFRKAVNNGEISYNDIHLSQMAQELRYGFLGKVNMAIIEACEVTEDGKIYLTAAGGISPTVCRLADKIVVELNSAHSKESIGMHDVYEPLDPPYRREIPVFKPNDRIGKPYVEVDPKKIVGVVKTDWPDEARSFTSPDPVTDQIGQNIANFLVSDMKKGIIPKSFLPVQSGVGNIANAVLGALGSSQDIPAFNVYTEVLQDAVIDLIRKERVKFGSCCSLTVTNDCLNSVYDDMKFFKDKLIIRQSEVSNNPEVIRRLGVISINTAIEADIYGNINSTHIMGTKMMNGIGGSGDFTRPAYISIFTTPSTAKDGKISTIVPLVAHTDHTEHDVNIIVTEYGVADLRGKGPKERAIEVIEKCAHPDYRPILREYLSYTDGKSQTPHFMKGALALHDTFIKTGDMRNIDWSKYLD
ncbi:succinate CoA transferase [Bacteroides coprosuis DSM 18011]|uniref:Succinate CoA transferase n=1 Tax=Bacteroides coprosuis DSM 18011 TaxID=679937 RepID=F3ZQR7_9BACE|nr:acetyl-CoA hydrolase/transferase family protein [Bacteroides coprosuis]EGJ70575.1 succinate CoA transferase [Bacteroides coprosuis DSM 18011]